MKDDAKTPDTEPEATKAPAALTPFETLHREIDQLFQNFRHGQWRSPLMQSPFEIDLPEAMRSYLPGTPAVDFVEREDRYDLSIEVPGVDMADVKVELSKGRLMIRGEKKEEKEEKESGRYVSERRYGAFSRSFRVPEDVDPEGIEALQENGVLKLRLPKRPEMKAEARQIKVKGK